MVTDVVAAVLIFDSFDFVEFIDVTSDEQFDNESELAIVVVKIVFSGRKNHDATDAHCKRAENLIIYLKNDAINEEE